MNVLKASLVVLAILSISRQSLSQLDSRSGFLPRTDMFSTFFGILREMVMTQGHKGFVRHGKHGDFQRLKLLY